MNKISDHFEQLKDEVDRLLKQRGEPEASIECASQRELYLVLAVTVGAHRGARSHRLLPELPPAMLLGCFLGFLVQDCTLVLCGILLHFGEEGLGCRRDFCKFRRRQLFEDVQRFGGASC